MSGSNGAGEPGAPSVIVERVGKVGVVRLNRPAKLNSLNPDAIKQLREGFVAHAIDDGVNAVLLEGEGRSFCAGGDQSGHPAIAPSPSSPTAACTAPSVRSR